VRRWAGGLVVSRFWAECPKRELPYRVRLPVFASCWVQARRWKSKSNCLEIMGKGDPNGCESHPGPVLSLQVETSTANGRTVLCCRGELTLIWTAPA
jgi:hypothetical protein